MNKKLHKLKEYIIESNDIPKSEQTFTGANLIINNDINRTKKKHDVLVVTDNPGEISWLVFKLKDISSNEINSLNKLSFYPDIGNLLNKAISNGKNLKEILIYVLDNLGEFEK